MDINELKNKTKSELHQILAESRDELRELKFKVGERQLAQVRRVRALKKDIARVLTALNDKSPAQSAIKLA